MSLDSLWNLQILYFFLITLAIATPLFIYGIISVRKIRSQTLRYQRVILPLKILGGVFLLSIIIKQIGNVAYDFTPIYLPFYFSDFAIFALVGFTFSKRGTLFNKMFYITFMSIAFIISIGLLIAPGGIIGFTSLINDDFKFNIVNGFISHYGSLYCFIWLSIWQIVKINFKDIKISLFTSLVMILIVMGTSYIFRCNYNYALASPLDENAHSFNDNWNYVNPVYAFCIWLPSLFALITGAFALNVLINKRIRKQWGIV